MYGRDGMSTEMKEILLYIQLQEGLRYIYVLKDSPAVLGAQGYKVLYLTAREEENRLKKVMQAKDGSSTLKRQGGGAPCLLVVVHLCLYSLESEETSGVCQVRGCNQKLPTMY